VSRAALMARPEAAPALRAVGPSWSPSDGLRVGGANDSFEREADHVADTVSAGGRIPGWSLSRMSIGQVQRASAPAEPAKARDSGLSLEEAFLRTALGRKLARSLSGGAHSAAAEERASSLRGTVVVGAEAAGAVASLAAAKGGLPARIPEIALDRVFPGLRVRVTYAGPADRPTQGSVAFTLGASPVRMPEGAGHPEPDPRAKPSPVKTLAAKEPAHAAALQDHPDFHHRGRAGAHEDAQHKREEISVQRKAERPGPFVADRSAVEPVLSAPGRPLDPETRTYMESRIGHDFGAVRIHTDSRAAESARELGAQAYTSGTSVVFGAGRYSPGTAEGRRLIAHELTHVVQQDRAPARAHPVIRRAPVQIQRAPEEEADTGAPDDSQGFVVRKLNALASQIPGFRLFTVILGRNPITDAPVERNAENVTHGVMALVPGGEEAFGRLKESGSLDKAFAWLRTEIDQLGFSIPYFKEIAGKAIESVTWRDFANPAGALARVAGFFRPPYEKLKRFALDALDKVLELIVEGVLSGLGGLGILEILKKAGATFKRIVKDPVGFLGNLLKALGRGFNQFKDRILEHLKNGLLKWLFGEIAATGLTLPKRFDLMGVMNLVLQVLGLTYARIRQRLVTLIGETPVAFLEGAFDVVVAMKKDGVGAAWKLILEKASGLLDTVMDAVRNWVVTKIVTAAVVQLVAMFNPVGAVIKAIQVIYQTITFLMEKAKELAEVGRAVVDSIAEIAEGNLTRAADFVEASMAKTIPPMLDFLARLIGLSGIGKAIRGVIEKVQARVDAAVGKVLEFIVGKAKDLLGKAKEGVVQAAGWWRERRGIRIGGEEHAVYMDGTEDAPDVMIASKPTPWSAYRFPAAPSDPEKTYRKQCNDIVAFLKKPIAKVTATDPIAQEKERKGNVEARRAKMTELAGLLDKWGIAEQPDKPVSIVRYGPPREDGGGTLMNAEILSDKKLQGSTVRDKPPIWTSLGERQSNYVQGHLLNNKLGGEGRRFNLTPITISANANHESLVESHVKRWVLDEGLVASYSVVPEYRGKHSPPAKYSALKAKAHPTGKELRQLGWYEAEMRLARGLKCEAYVLKYQKGKWAEDAGAKGPHARIDRTVPTPIAS